MNAEQHRSMKRMIAAAVVAAMTVSSAMAQAVTTDQARYLDLSKLTTQQKADLMKEAATMERSKEAGVSEKTREEIGKWGELGVGMGRAAVSAAKEVGVAANEFVQTPLGKVTMGVVVYKIIGQEVLKLAVCLFITMVMLVVAILMVFRKKGVVEYNNIPVLGGLWVKRRVTKYIPDSDIMIGHLLVAVVCVVLGTTAILNAF